MRLLSLTFLTFLVITANSCRFFNGEKNKLKILAEEKARQDSLRVADSIRKAYDLAARETVRTDSLMKQERLARENKFSIIVGSFHTSSYARTMAAEFEHKGYSPRIIKPMGSNFELVSAEGHEQYRSALKRLKIFQDSLGGTPWIYQLKQNERFISE
jgi:hypothetical protein